jgi:hypothetical protein
MEILEENNIKIFHNIEDNYFKQIKEWVGLI